MAETIKDVVVKIRMDADADSLRRAAEVARSGGAGGVARAAGGGGSDTPRSDAVEKRHEEERLKLAALQSRAVVHHIRTQEQLRREKLAGFVEEKRNEEAIAKVRAQRIAAEQSAARQSMQNQRNEIERIGRLAEGIGNVARAFTFLGGSASESLETAVRGIMAVEAAIRGVQGALQVGQAIREGIGAARMARGAAGGVVGGAVRGAGGSIAGGAIGGAGMSAAAGAMSAFTLSAGAAVALPVVAGITATAGAFYDTHRERRAKEQDELERYMASVRDRRRNPGIVANLQHVDPEMRANMARDRMARDIADFGRLNRQADNPMLDAALRMRGARMGGLMDRDAEFSGRQGMRIRRGEIGAMQADQRGLRGQFVADNSVGRGADNLEKQAQLQERIVGLMRQQVAAARDLRAAATERVLAAQGAVENEEDRRRNLKAFVGGLDPGRRAVLKRLNDKAAAGQELTREEEMQLQEAGGGMFDDFIARKRAGRVKDDELAGLVGGFQRRPLERGEGGAIGGANDELARLREAADKAVQEQVAAFKRAAAAQEKEAKEIEMFAELIKNAAQFREKIFQQMNRIEADAQAREREKAANRQAGVLN